MANKDSEVINSLCQRPKNVAECVLAFDMETMGPFWESIGIKADTISNKKNKKWGGNMKSGWLVILATPRNHISD